MLYGSHPLKGKTIKILGSALSSCSPQKNRPPDGERFLFLTANPKRLIFS
jgi:hypothetical protein